MSQVHETILQQLGKNKFIAMTGAYNLMSHENTLSFRLHNKPVNYVKITLNHNDTYLMEFSKIWGRKHTPLYTINNVYNHQLKEIFTKYTGLDTYL